VSDFAKLRSISHMERWAEGAGGRINVFTVSYAGLRCRKRTSRLAIQTIDHFMLRHLKEPDKTVVSKKTMTRNTRLI
jgi:hypothetical protein